MRIAIRNFSASIGPNLLVSIEDLAFTGPGWVGIIGANGSAKTTLLRAISGRLATTSGVVELDGNILERAGRVAALSLAPSIEMLPEELTGVDILNLASRQTGASIENERLAELLDVLDLRRFWHRQVSTYSAGMRQRLAIYTGFVSGHRVVCLDEPFNWLDPVVAYDCKTAIGNLAANDTLVISALHDMATFIQCCHQGLVMSGGKSLLTFAPVDMAKGKTDFAGFERRIIAEIRSRASSRRT